MIKINSPDKERSEFGADDLVCYCFQYTRAQIERDYMDTGSSTIPGIIILEKETGGCDCARKNSRGS